MITFDNVTKLYDRNSRPALNSVSLDVDRGEFVFLVGASGSGKSTFIRLIMKEEHATKGTVYVAGANVARIPSWRVPRLRRGIGVVFQDFRLLPNKTVFANVAFAMQVIGRSRAVIRDSVPEVLKTVGLEGKDNRMPHELSGGEQQRVCIARALINESEILFADEPTGNLDAENEQTVLRIFAELHAQNRTIVMVTHNPDLGAQTDRIIRLQHGKIQE